MKEQVAQLELLWQDAVGHLQRVLGPETQLASWSVVGSRRDAIASTHGESRELVASSSREVSQSRCAPLDHVEVGDRRFGLASAFDHLRRSKSAAQNKLSDQCRGHGRAR